MSKGSKTRSGLLREVERLINECTELPQVLLMENVTQVHGKKNKADFDKWCDFLQSKGYSNYWQDLNAKNYGVPQNRNRTFMISLLENYTYEFPEPFELELRFKDVLENEVDDSCYLSDKGIEYIKKRDGKYTRINPEIPCAITAKGNQNWTGNFIKEETPKRLLNIYGQDKGTGYAGNVWDKDKISPTINTCQGGNRQPMIIEEPIICTSRGHNPNNQKDRIRKLTQLECWRLMNFDDEDFYAAQKALNNTFYKGSNRSKSQLYKQAGNCIVVNVLCEIFNALLKKE